MIGLTEKQEETLKFVMSFSYEYGYMPTIAEIANNFVVDYRAIVSRLEALQKKGYIKREKKKARSIKIVKSI